jgi:hypothetical protein
MPAYVSGARLFNRSDSVDAWRFAAAPASAGDLQQAVTDLRIHQIELQMQNDELRRTQAALVDSHERYLDLYDLAPVGFSPSTTPGSCAPPISRRQPCSGSSGAGWSGSCSRRSCGATRNPPGIVT